MENILSANIYKEKNAGWKYLIDFSDKGKLLVLGSIPGPEIFSLAKHFTQAAVFHHDAPEITKLDKQSKIQGINNLKLFQLESRHCLSQGNDDYGVVVLYDIDDLIEWYQKACDTNNAKGAFYNLVQDVNKILSSNGSLFISFKNILGYDRLRFKSRGKRYLSMFSIKDCIKKANFHNCKTYLFLPFLNPLYEAIAFESEYKTSDNSFYLKGIIKDHLLSSKVFRYFSPAYGLLCNKKREIKPKALVEKILLDINSKLKSRDLISQNNLLSIKRYRLCNPDTVLINLAFDKKEPNGVLVRLPMNEKAVDRCKHAFQMLADIDNSNLRFSSYIPKPVFQNKYEGQPYFIETALKGIAIDIPFSKFTLITAKASNLLIDFHLETRDEFVIDTNIFDLLFKEFIDKLARHLVEPKKKKWFELMHLLKESSLGLTIPLVCMHGDYKIENLLFDHQTFELKGLIDWDLAKWPGPPLLDLLYLLGYNRTVLNGTSMIDFMKSLLISPCFDKHEEEIWKAYFDRLNIDSKLIFLLSVLFWLHHIIDRTGIDATNSANWMKDNVYDVLDFICQAIKNKPI